MFGNLNVLCFSETLATIEDLCLPHFFIGFDNFQILAAKKFRVGRPSGGLLILTNKTTVREVEIIDSSEPWIYLKCKINRKHLIISNVYSRPKSQKIIFDKFKSVLYELSIQFCSTRIIIAGDFNARISDLNSTDEEIFENSSLFSIRTSLDNIMAIEIEKKRKN